MKANVYLSFTRLVLVPVVAATLIGCATTPATLRHAERVDSCPCDLNNSPLGVLLEHALADPESADSAHALAHFVERWHRQKRDSSEGILDGSSADGSARRYSVKFDGPHSRYALSYFDEISPATDYEVKKIPHHRRDGVGAPLVALRENRPENWALDPVEKFYPPEAITRPLTAVVRNGKLNNGIREVQIDLICPLQEHQVEIDGKTRALAVDLSVPWAALLARTKDLKRSQLLDFVDSSPKREPRLYLMEPYDPNKEPLIMIHGLLGSPLIWAKLSNTLWADDEIRSRYQIWHFLYNTSAPALYSGRMLRDQLREVRPLLDPSGNDPAMQSTTVIAHSMGAIITRSLLTKPENIFWDAAFTQSFDSLKLSDADRESLREAFYWDSTPHVKRVIYIAGSHRGSDFADNLIGRLGRLAARPPKSGFKDFYERISKANPGAFTKAYAALGKGSHDSIHALSPRQPTLPTLASLPNNHPVREFSIIGNRGKAGPLDDSSDGIVPYWSSHIDRAESEKIVPTSHNAFNHEETIAEVKRILRLP